MFKDELLLALNVMFYKIPRPSDMTGDELAEFWVAELWDKGIKLRWDTEAGEFKRAEKWAILKDVLSRRCLTWKIWRV